VLIDKFKQNLSGYEKNEVILAISTILDFGDWFYKQLRVLSKDHKELFDNLKNEIDPKLKNREKYFKLLDDLKSEKDIDEKEYDLNTEFNIKQKKVFSKFFEIIKSEENSKNPEFRFLFACAIVKLCSDIQSSDEIMI